MTTTEPMPDRAPAAGRYELAAAGYEATIATAGATLCALRHAGRDLVLPLIADGPVSDLRGALLAPWPNRTAGGRYEFAGQVHQLPVNERATGNAAHGFAAVLEFEAVLIEADRLVLRSRIEPRPGYPWWVAVEVEFALTARGLSQEVRATNESVAPAPFGMGGHPYLLAGRARAGAIDEWSLAVPARRVLLVDDERMLPTGVVDLGSPGARHYDFRGGRPLRGAVLNNAYTGFDFGCGATARVAVVDARGVGAAIEWDERCRWVQLYTADAATGADHRGAIAVEPMTCPPDAFNSKRDLVSLAPGATTSAGWLISVVQPRERRAESGGVGASGLA